MKRILVLLLALLLASTAMAEVNNELLESADNMAVYVDDNGVDLVIRPMNQPYMGESDQPDVDVCAYLDYVELPQEHATVVRLLVCLASEEMINARTLQITEGGRTYTFDVDSCRTVSEYDMEYYEDYAVCLTDESLPLLKAMARSAEDQRTFILSGERTVTASVQMSGADAALLYDLYVNAGGDKQDLGILRDLWPVAVSK